MKLHLLTILVATAALVLLRPLASAAEHPFAANLTEIERGGDCNALLVAACKPANADELRAALDWLFLRVDNGKGGARYIYMSAYNLWAGGKKDVSTAYLLHAMLCARADAARGADPSAAPIKISQLDEQFTTILDYFRQLDAGTKEKYVKFALALEEKSRTREKDAWLCAGGVSFTQKYLEKHGSYQGAKQVDAPNHLGGKMTVLEDDEIKPEFVSDAVWAIRRQEVRAAFLSRMLK